MKTSILLNRHRAEVFDRYTLPIDENPSLDKRLLRSYQPGFMLAHDVVSRQFKSDFSLGKPRTEHEPDQLTFGKSSVYLRVKRGRVSENRVRVISDEYVKALDALDRELEALHRKQRRLMAEAWRRGRALRADEIRQEVHHGQAETV